jgi:flavin-dependent dehydrogenase
MEKILDKIKVDIVIVGGGLAGLSAAKAIFNKSNLSVAIVEGDSIGSNNPTPLTFPDVIKKYELLDCIKEKYSSFMFHNHRGSSVEYLLPPDALVALNYKKTCRKIFDIINNSSNNLKFINEFVTDIKKNDGMVQTDLRNGVRINSKILIDASGKAQLVANKFGQNRVQYYSHVYGAFFSDVRNLDKDMACYLLPSKEFGSGGGWFYSINRKSASFGYAQITDSPKTDNESLINVFKRALKGFNPYSDYLRDAKIEHIEKGVIPISYINKFVLDNIIVVGDAAGIATNWVCMGVEPALKYGSLAGVIAVESLKGDDYNKLYSFQAQWEKENKAKFDCVAKHVTTFWESDHYFWEWIIKNDLAYLTPNQVLGRLRGNSYLPNKYQLFLRALRFKMKCMLNRKAKLPEPIVIG